METSVESQFGKIALCLSGGGYRAAAFHLGTLSMLNELGLLGNAKYFSSASGGTLTAMKYAISRMEGKEFPEFFAEMSEFLTQINVVKEAFEILETTPSPTGTNDLSLIRAGAEVYRRKLTGRKILSDSRSEEWTVKHLRDFITSHNAFDDLIFNSTEFRTGNGFRFRTLVGREVLFGNKNTSVRSELSEQISLADITASSSCFPGVFEPMRFAQDFQLADRSAAERPFLNSTLGMKSVALMDGGIFDNQGLHGMTVSYNDEPLPFGLLLVSDTTSRTDEILKYDIDQRKKGISVKHILWLIIGFLCMLTVSALVLLRKTFLSDPPLSLGEILAFSFSGIFLLIFSGSVLVLVLLGIRRVTRLSIMGADFPIWSYLKDLNVRDIRTLLRGRIFSAKAMAFSVFMKRIRSLQLSSTMGAIAKSSRNNLFNGITAFANIYGLSSTDSHDGFEALGANLEATPGIEQISDVAEKVGTKLWLDEGEFKTLVNCGRTTTCHALLKHVCGNEKFEALPKPNDASSPFHGIYQKWRELRTDFP